MHTISNRLAAIATFLAAGAALAGLAVPGLYVDAPNWVQQAQGTDLATLFLAVPVLIVGLWTASRGSAAGRLAVVAGLLYLVYNYAIFAFSVAMNPLTAVHIAIFGLSLWSLLLAGRSAVDGAEAVTERLNRRAAGGLLVGVGAMFGLLWLGADRATRRPASCRRTSSRPDISSNPVYALDLAFFLPLCALAGVGLLRRNGAAAFAFPMLVWVPLMGAGVVGGIVLMAVAGDQTAVPVAVVITVLGVVSSILAAVAVVRPEQRRGVRPDHRPSRPPGRLNAMLAIERILAAAAVFVAAHFAMGFINSSAGGSGGSLLFPFATDAPTRWAFGSLDGMLGLLSPVMIGLAGIAVLTFFLAFFSSLGLWVPADMWRPLVLVGVVCSVALLVASSERLRGRTFGTQRGLGVGRLDLGLDARGGLKRGSRDDNVVGTLVGTSELNQLVGATLSEVSEHGFGTS